MQRRTFLKVLGGAAIVPALSLATGCSTRLPANATDGWRRPGHESDPRRWVLSYALLAPHSHNLQSWIADLREPNQINLSCDLSRLLPETDPYARQIMLSHGTFLELLDIAARELGLRADIELFPAGHFGPRALDTRPVARIRLSPDATVQKDLLFAQILRRRTNRNPYDSQRRLPQAAWQAIVQSPAENAIQIGYVDLAQPSLLAQHRQIAAAAWRTELTTPRVVRETYRLLRIGADEIAKHRDGIAILDSRLVWLDRLGLFDRTQVPTADSYATQSQLEEFEARLAATPAFFWMSSRGNDRATQIAAGRAYARVQLTATAHGVAMQPLQQALQEYPEQQSHYRAIHRLCGADPATHTVQMWARIGYGPQVSPSPRRALEQIIRP